MDLGILVETIVHHLLIWEMTSLGYLDGFPMISKLLYVMHTRHDLQWL